MELTVELWNALIALPRQHPTDNEFIGLSIHRLQHLIMIRSTRRIHPDIFYSDENVHESAVDPVVEGAS